MIRRAAILMLMAAFSLATTPSFACTGISLKAKDGAAIRSRTLEFGFPLQSNVLVVPAGKEFSGTLPGGGKGLTYKSRYGIVGANALGATATIDVERSGLVDRSVLFPGLRPVRRREPGRRFACAHPQDFGMWVLGNFATVDEVKRALTDVVMVPTPFPGLGSTDGIAADVIFFIQDKTGKSIAVDLIGGKLKVTDVPLGVMTNAPTYDWHMTNLDNYINMSVKDIESANLGDVKLQAFGSG